MIGLLLALWAVTAVALFALARALDRRQAAAILRATLAARSPGPLVSQARAFGARRHEIAAAGRALTRPPRVAFEEVPIDLADDPDAPAPRPTRRRERREEPQPIAGDLRCGDRTAPWRRVVAPRRVRVRGVTWA